MENEVTRFGVWDYLVLGGMLLVSAVIGIYYACSGGKQQTATEYLLADRKASPLPVAFSLVASFVSAITVLGVPAEVYAYGSRYWLFGFAFIVAGCITSLTMPVFVRLRLTSANEYLELRFNSAIRLVGTTITFFSMSLPISPSPFLFFSQSQIFYIAVVIYAPALALNQVSGVSLWGCAIATGVVCTFYTTIGGMNAVLWTDVFQSLVMMCGLLAVIIQGSNESGGMDNVWSICQKGGRINFWEFDPDPTIRHSFWSIVIGGGFTWGAIYGISQAQVMRYLACGKVKTARLALGMAIVGMIIVLSSAVLAGMVIYARYATCDPFRTGRVTSGDQLMPFIVLDLFGDTPGLSGLFTASIFSAAMSTASSGLNALTAVTTEDLVTKMFPRVGKSEKLYAIVSKIVLLSYGAICILLTYVASYLGSVLQLTLSLGGMLGGPGLGLFTLGMFFPWANSKGALVGVLVALAWSLWVGVGTYVDGILYPRNPGFLPLDISGCPAPPTVNTTMTTLMMETTSLQMTSEMMLSVAPPMSPPEPLGIYRLSYIWLGFYSWMITLVLGLLVSFITGATDPRKLDPALISPIADWFFCCLPASWKSTLRCRVGKHYKPDETDLVKGEACEVKGHENGIELLNGYPVGCEG
ncbi:sodium-coupled monocarboxylate transporter 1-like [Strongylocentrotus purpuratus]|uniref:Sodium-coupled monocarboxylate transporter 1 n=1 Tax=Strongylocentrotus purpuratus TaxID=7668 RepID=A0A7M7SVP3_STRPU|nr:sodium-coupled monocarboxylate transporter 1-like [Strongylocentrotus purpuratus]